MRFCKDCKHFAEPSVYSPARCDHPSLRGPVWDRSDIEAEEERREGSCGMDAKHFEYPSKHRSIRIMMLAVLAFSPVCIVAVIGFFCR